MNTMIRLTLSLALAGLVLSGPVIAEDSLDKLGHAASSSKSQQNISVLFVLSANKATITKTSTGYELTLQGIDDKVLWFTDRPVRKSGFRTSDLFIKRWERMGSSFGKTPPNAVMTQCCRNGDTNCIDKAVAVELSNPVKLSDQSWKFSLKDLGEKLNVGSYSGVRVFVDSFLMGPWHFF